DLARRHRRHPHPHRARLARRRAARRRGPGGAVSEIVVAGGGPPPPRPWFPGGERTAAFVLLLALLYAAYLTVRPFLLAGLLAAAVASRTHRASRFVARRLGNRPRLGAALTTFVLIVGVLGPLVTGLAFAAEKLIAEALTLAQQLRHSGHALDDIAAHLGPLG